MIRTLAALALCTLPLVAEDPPSIKVIGVAEERVPPDQLSFSCQLRSTGEDLAEVAKTHRDRAAEITKLLRGLGLGEDELKTGSASFGEDVEWHDRERIHLGYEASTAITITTTKLDLYDTLWLELAKYPEVAVKSADFGLKDRAEVRKTARTKALQAARAKALEMAAALDARTGAVLSIVENPSRISISSNRIGRNSIDSILTESERGSLEPGLVSVVERVEVTFELDE